MTDSTHDVEFYLSHSGYVRALARQIVFNEHRAADVEQEAWLAALRHAPRDGDAPRPWFATVVRNFALKALRSDDRRAAREEFSARNRSEIPTPHDILEHEEARRRVVEALLALEDPYRTVLLLRFFDGLGPSEIARRLRLPTQTVRTQLRRGIERLRERMSRDAHWAAFLVRAFDLSPPGPAAMTRVIVRHFLRGVGLVNTTQKVLVAAAFALLIACAFLVYDSDVEATPALDVEDVATSQSAVERREDAPNPVAGERTRVDADASTPTSSTTPQLDSGSISVRILWSDLSAAAGVHVFVGSAGDDELLARPLRLRADADGRLVIPTIAAGLVTIEPDRGGYGATTVTPNEHTELEVVIPRGYDVEGVTVDAQGDPVTDARVMLWHGRQPPYEELEVARTDALGHFQIRSIGDELTTTISARHPRYAPTRRTATITRAGALQSIRLVFDADGVVAAGRVSDDSGEPIAGARVLIGPETLGEFRDEPDGSATLAAAGTTVLTDEQGHFRLEGLAAGPSEVRVRAPGFAPWSNTMEIGSTPPLDVRLAREAVVRGVVRDDRGVVVERAFVRTAGEFGFAGAIATSGADGAFELRGLPIGEVELIARSIAGGEDRLQLETAGGVEYVWDVVLSRGLTIRGRLEVAGHSPADWNVGAQAAGAHDSDAMRFARTDSDGRFEFSSCADAEHRLFASPPGELVVDVGALHRVRPGPAEVVLHVDAELAPSVRVVGRVVDSEHQPIAGVTLEPRSRRLVRVPMYFAQSDSGRFELGPWPAGRWQLRIAAAGFVERNFDEVELAVGETWDLGTVVLERGAELRVSLNVDHDVTGVVSGIHLFSDENGAQEWLEGGGVSWWSSSLAPGRYHVIPFGDGDIALQSTDVDVSGDGPLSIEVRVRRGERVDWIYRDATGSVPGGHVNVVIEDHRGVVLQRRSLSAVHGELASNAAFVPGRYVVIATTTTGLEGRLELDLVGSADRSSEARILRLR